MGRIRWTPIWLKSFISPLVFLTDAVLALFLGTVFIGNETVKTRSTLDATKANPNSALACEA